MSTGAGSPSKAAPISCADRLQSAGSLDIIEVYEKGLHAHECYFPNPTVFEEGRRYLLFLKRTRSIRNGFAVWQRGCALDVLVDSENRYVLRLPVTGIDLSDPLYKLARSI